MRTAEIDVVAGLARDFGVRVDAPVVLNNGANLLLHLAPAPVVARVATATALIRPGVAAWLARDVALAGFLGARGVPVTRPAEELSAGPGQHERDGLAVAFWRYEAHDPGFTPDGATVARMLGELHCALDEYPGELPAGGPFDDTAHAIDALAARGLVTAGEADGLREAADRLRTALAGYPVRPLHGDAHPGNLLATPARLLWNDFEDTWCGPLEWDLACLANSTRLDGHAALAHYPEPFDAEALRLCLELRRLFGVCWTQLLAHRSS